MSVPAVIYTIPPRCPIYYVRYVRVYSYTPAVAYVGYTSGYTGCYVYRNTVVYGTGYRYRPWLGRFYYPRPWTWGFGVHYDPWTGWSMGFSTGWWRPNGWFAYNWRGVHPGWWGPVGYRPVYRPTVGPVYRVGYHPIYRPPVRSGGTRTMGTTRGTTLYDGWKSGVRRPVTGDAGRSATGRADTRRVIPTPTETRPVPQTDVSRATRQVARPSQKKNNVYVAPDGNVLRKTPEGWQQRERKTWRDTPRAPASSDVSRDSRARERGAERSAGVRSEKPERSAPSKAPKQREVRDKKERR